jgi:uncharacterized membrane protein HdeD (DUF308 family)
VGLTEHERSILARLEQDEFARSQRHRAGPLVGILLGGAVCLMGVFTGLVVVIVLGFVAIVTGVIATAQAYRAHRIAASPVVADAGRLRPWPSVDVGE